MPKATDASPDDIKVQVPGEETPPDDPAAPPAPPEQQDDSAARIAQLEAEVAQLRATNEALNERLLDAAEASSAPPEPRAPRLIAPTDWINRTSAEARAAGVTERVLCSDGYFCPGQ